METLGEYLKTKMTTAGLTQDKLAEKLSYKSGQFISNWTRGVSYPPATAIPTLAKVLGVTTQELGNKVVEGIINSYSTEIKTKYGV